MNAALNLEVSQAVELFIINLLRNFRYTMVVLEPTATFCLQKFLFVAFYSINQFSYRAFFISSIQYSLDSPSLLFPFIFQFKFLFGIRSCVIHTTYPHHAGRLSLSSSANLHCSPPPLFLNFGFLLFSIFVLKVSKNRF